MLRAIIDRLAAVTWPELTRAGEQFHQLGTRTPLLLERDPLRRYDFPICRPVAERLGLVWWSEDLLYRVADSPQAGRAFTFAEYVLAATAERRKRLREAHSAAA